MGLIDRLRVWMDQGLMAPIFAGQRFNTFDCDGVIFINEEIGGVYPGPHDVIITGRSYEEIREMQEMLHERGIRNRVFYNRVKFVNKTRHNSGWHKAQTIKRLQKLGHVVMCHFEDDPVQAEVIKQHCPEVTVVMLVHGLTSFENVRHQRKS